jgi:hypothetical protein
MPCGGQFVGRAGETFQFCLVQGEAVCDGQRVTTDTTSGQTVGDPVRYTDEELRQCVEWQLEEERDYDLRLLCAPPGSALTVRVTVGAQSFDQSCTARPNGSVGPWIVSVAPAAAAAGEEAEAAGEGGAQ